MKFPTRIALATVILTASLIQPAAAVDVTKFGAIPGDGKDDTVAFLAAFDAALTNAVREIQIPKGRYDLRADGNPRSRGALFWLRQVDGLKISGRGAELMMSGVAGVFSFENCRDVSVEGLTVDWARPSFSQGVVITNGSRQFDVFIEENYPVVGGEPVTSFMSYDLETRRPYGKDLDVYDAVEKTELVSPQVLRVFLKRNVSVRPGTLLVLRHQTYGPGVFRFHRCGDVRVKDVTVFTCPGMSLVGNVCTNIALKHYNVLLRPKSGRMMSATADATHFGGCKGTISLEDCTFEGMGDDGVNVKSGLYLTVKERVDDRTVLCQHNLKMADVPDAGDDLELSHPENLLPFATNRVAAAILESGTNKIHRVTFAAPLPADLRPGDLLGNASRVPKLRMKHCTVRYNRARGVLCQTRDAVIEDCTFRGCTGPGVMVLTEISHFHESIGTHDVTVRNNVFENCNQGAATAEAPLAAFAWLKGSKYPPQPGVHRDVRLEGNRITGSANSGIFAAGVDGLVIRKNVIAQACLKPRNENGRAVIRVLDCARTDVSNNDIAPAKQGAGMKLPVSVTETAAQTR